MKRTLLLLFLLCSILIMSQSCAEENGSIDIRGTGSGETDSGGGSTGGGDASGDTDPEDDASGDTDPEDDASGDAPSAETLTWNFVDAGLTANQSNDSRDPSIEALGSSIYITWTEKKDWKDKVLVNKWDGTDWSLLKGKTDDSINLMKNQNAFSSKLEVFNGELFIGWVETRTATPKTNQIRIAKYSVTGNDWDFKDGGDAKMGINFDANQHAFKPVLAVSSSKLYAIWNEEKGTNYNQIRVKELPDTDSEAWASVDGSGDQGLNLSSGETAEISDIVDFSGTLFAAFGETTSGAKQIRVKQKTGTSTWDWVDNSGSTTNGINHNTNVDASNPVLCVFNSKLYTAWEESNSIRVAQWEGGQTWRFIDGDDANGLRKDNSQAAKTPELVVFDAKLYAIWSEANGTADQIRVARWDGDQSWTFVDGNSVNGLNFDKTKSASNPEAVVADSNKLYITWAETDGNSGVIRVVEGVSE